MGCAGDRHLLDLARLRRALARQLLAVGAEERERAGLLVGDDAQPLRDDGERLGRFLHRERHRGRLGDDGETGLGGMRAAEVGVHADDARPVEENVLGDAVRAKLDAILKTDERESVVRRGSHDLQLPGGVQSGLCVECGSAAEHAGKGEGMSHCVSSIHVQGKLPRQRDDADSRCHGEMISCVLSATQACRRRQPARRGARDYCSRSTSYGARDSTPLYRLPLITPSLSPSSFTSTRSALVLTYNVRPSTTRAETPAGVTGPLSTPTPA